jgi:haloalkane dehalogenase
MYRLPFVLAALLWAGTALSQQAPDPRAGVFSAEFPYESKFVEVAGHKLHYIDKGTGQTFLFLHGNPTSSYLWRNVMRYVEPSGRVVAVDNIGFGQSDQPQIDYTFQDHYRYIEGFIQALDLKDLILVVHDWGSVLGLNYARENPANVRGVVFMEAIIPPGFPMADLTALGGPQGLFASFRTPDAGKKLLIEENVFIEQLLAGGTLTRQMSQAEVDVYRQPFLDPASRFPIYVWPNELPIAGVPARNVVVVNAVGEWLKTSSLPKLLQYASPGAIVPPSAAEWMAANYRNIETQFVGYGAHYIQEDNPEAIGRGIADWYRRNFTRPH